MTDRTPTQVLANGALRYGVYDASGELLRYEYIRLEDAPTAIGTPLSKANLMSDDTENAIFGSTANRTVNQALAAVNGKAAGNMLSNWDFRDPVNTGGASSYAYTSAEITTINRWKLSNHGKVTLEGGYISITNNLSSPSGANTCFSQRLPVPGGGGRTICVTANVREVGPTGPSGPVERLACSVECYNSSGTLLSTSAVLSAAFGDDGYIHGTATLHTNTKYIIVKFILDASIAAYAELYGVKCEYSAVSSFAMVAPTSYADRAAKCLAEDKNGEYIGDHPVGSIYISVDNINPGLLFGGTWVAWGSGRVPVGVNTSDSNFNTVEKTGGASTVAITGAQVGPHVHPVIAGGDAAGQAAGGTDYLVAGYTDTTHPTHMPFTIGQNTGGEAHNNLQPYITCYMWKRTA